MVRVVDIPWVGRSKYHGKGGQNAMVRGGVNILWIGGQNTMDRDVKIPSIGDENTMGRGVKIPWVGGSIYHF